MLGFESRRDVVFRGQQESSTVALVGRRCFQWPNHRLHFRAANERYISSLEKIAHQRRYLGCSLDNRPMDCISRLSERRRTHRRQKRTSIFGTKTPDAANQNKTLDPKNHLFLKICNPAQHHHRTIHQSLFLRIESTLVNHHPFEKSSRGNL